MGRDAKSLRKKSKQFGVLAYVVGADGVVRVCLVTSRETRRWVIPKGWPMKGRAPHEAAAQEAFEEAGLVGDVGDAPIGAFAYWKRLRRTFRLCTVEVFPLAVREEKDAWPERDQRRRGWFTLEAAAEAVDEPGLETLIAGFDPLGRQLGGTIHSRA